MRSVRFAFRTLMRAKAYAFLTVAILAIAIGANTAMFGVLYAVLLREQPYPEPSRLVEVGRAAGPNVESITYPLYERWRDNAHGFVSLAAYFQFTGVSRVTITSGQEPEPAKAGFVSARFFEVMGVAPRLGRVFTYSEEQSRESVAVLSDRLWRKYFGESDSIGNAVIHINGLGYRVIGVMPDSFALPAREAAAWLPITANREWARRAGPVPFFRVIGRLAPGVSVSAAQAELQSMFDGEKGTAGAIPLRPPIGAQQKRTLYMLTAAVGFVLLIACTNIASLTLARGSKRAGEIALRAALGAGRSRLAAEMFLESLLIAGTAAIAGVLIAAFGLEILVRFRPPNVERFEEAALTGAVLVFSLIAAFGSAVLSGLLPAWKLSGRDPIESLRGLARGASAAVAGVRLRKALVAAQVALTLTLLAGSGIMLRSLAAAQKVDLGFEPSRALTFRVLFQDKTPSERKVEYFRTLFDRLRTVPQVESAGAINDLFEVFAPAALGLRAVEGRPPEPRDAWSPLTWTTVGGDYFQAMGAQLLRGRWFSETDGPNAPLVALIDEGAARRYWPVEDPIGRRFKGQDARGVNDDWITVIGVVKNIRRQGVDREPTPHVYEWYRQGFNIPRDVLVRTAAPIGNEIRAIARSVDPTVALSDVKRVDSEIEEQLSPRRFQTALLGTFAGIALLLSLTGIYGVVNYSIAARSREFGIRTALGEPRPVLCGRVLREALSTAAAGMLPGLCGVALLSGVVRSFVFGVSALDPVSIVGASLLIALSALFAASAPAIRVSHIDPAAVLHEE